MTIVSSARRLLTTFGEGMDDAMRNLWTIVIAAGSLLGSACASGHMSDGSSEMHAAIGDVRAENARHLQACGAADSIAGLMDELGRHERGMGMMMGRMESVLDGMCHCSTGGMDRMSQGMSNMDAIVSDHRLRLEAAVDVGAAHAECDEHAAAIDLELRGMDDELGRMSCMGP
jgi:hypothetical protein